MEEVSAGIAAEIVLALHLVVLRWTGSSPVPHVCHQKGRCLSMEPVGVPDTALRSYHLTEEQLPEGNRPKPPVESSEKLPEKSARCRFSSIRRTCSLLRRPLLVNGASRPSKRDSTVLRDPDRTKPLCKTPAGRVA